MLSHLKEAFRSWREDHASRLGAALSFYTALSLAPLVILALSIIGIVFERESAEAQILRQIQGLMGTDGTQAIKTVIDNAQEPATSKVAAGIGLIMLFVGASGVFVELQNALNIIWKVEPKKTKGILHFLRRRFLSFSMVLGIGFLLLVSLILSTLIAALGEMIRGLPIIEILAVVLNFIVSFGIISFLFAMIFKFLPETYVPWRAVWPSALLTSLLFSIGKFLIGLYLGNSSIGSAYGAAGSLVVVLVWVYYSAQILFFGAEYSRVCAQGVRRKREIHDYHSQPSEALTYD
jgi:membrane protein